MGVSSGASLGATLAILVGVGSFLGSGYVGLVAFAGAFLVSMGVIALANIGGRATSVKLILAGTALSAICAAVSNFFLYVINTSSGALEAVVRWTMGSLAGITREKILPTVLCVGFCGGLLFLLQRQITLLALDPDEAALLGVDVDRMRHLVLILATLTVASIVSVTGLISFIGLLAPHIARLLDRRGGSHALALSGMIGAALLLLADCAARTLSSSEIPISILTSFMGAPFLIWLIARRDSVWQ